MTFLQKTTLLFILTLPLLLSSCGFSLRSSFDLPPALKTLYFESIYPYNSTSQTIRSTLQRSDVHLVDLPEQAPFSLHILEEHFTTTQSTVGSSQQMRDYTATYHITYSIKNKQDRTLIGPKTISAQRTITVTANELLENSNKSLDAKQKMIQEITTRMMHQLESYQTKAILNAKETKEWKHASLVHPSIQKRSIKMT